MEHCTTGIKASKTVFQIFLFWKCGPYLQEYNSAVEVSCRTSVWFQASIQFRLQVLSGFQRQSSPDTHTCTLYCITVCVCVCMSLSRGQLFVTPWTVAHQAPLSIGFSRQEYWVGKIPRRRAWQPTPVFLPGESPWTVAFQGISPTDRKSVV